MKSKVIMGIVLTLLFTSMFTLTFNIQPVKASGDVVIRADGSVDPPGAPISSVDNITYTFTGNIYDEIFVERSNIIVDGNGSTLQGTGSGNGIGIISTVSNVTIKNMEINGWVVGIYINASSNYHSISGNRIKNNTYGILLQGSFNSVSGNNITNNNYGVYLERTDWLAHNNTVSGNTITNGDYGVYLYESSNNTFYHNNFRNNTQQVYSDNSTNVWDDGYPSGGNYWSDYNGTDSYSGPNQDQPSSGDGIGDTPYNVTVTDTQQDRYPLMNPWTPTKTIIEVLGVSHPVAIESNTTITQIAATNDTLSFTSSGPAGEKGYILLIFPMVNTTEIHVYVDGVEITPVINTNGTHYFIYFEFTLSRRYIRIRFAPDWWPMFHHDLSHTGYSTSIAPNTNNTLWSYPTNGAVWSSPAVVDGRVYVGSNDNKTYCLDASTGAHIWNYTTGGDVRSSPAVADGRVYVGSFDNKVYCLNASAASMTPNEREIWNYTTDHDVYSSPAVADGKVFVGSCDSKVHCINASDGAHIWNYTTNGPVFSSPAVVDGRVYVGSNDWKVYCLNASAASMTPNEREIWNYTTNGPVYSSPAVADGKVYVGSNDNKVHCINASDGAHIWNYTTGHDVYSSPAVADGKVYVGSYNTKVHCLNASAASMTPNEREIWNYTTNGPVRSSPAVADGRVHVGSHDNKVYAFGICGVNITVALSQCGVPVTDGYTEWQLRPKVGCARCLEVDVTVKNNGTVRINCTVNVYYHDGTTWVQIEPWQTITITGLDPCNTATPTFQWTLGWLTECTTYNVKANVTTTCGATDTDTTTIYIRLTGDVDGYDDVTILDVGKVAMTFATASYNVMHDIDGDCDVDIIDLGKVAMQFALEATCP